MVCVLWCQECKLLSTHSILAKTTNKLHFPKYQTKLFLSASHPPVLLVPLLVIPHSLLNPTVHLHTFLPALFMLPTSSSAYFLALFSNANILAWASFRSPASPSCFRWHTLSFWPHRWLDTLHAIWAHKSSCSSCLLLVLLWLTGPVFITYPPFGSAASRWPLQWLRRRVGAPPRREPSRDWGGLTGSSPRSTRLLLPVAACTDGVPPGTAALEQWQEIKMKSER